MPVIGQPLEATSPSTQAMATGIAAPEITFRPGGGRKANVYTTEPLLQQACTAAAGMDGPFTVHLDTGLASGTYTAGGDLALGANTALVGVLQSGSGAVPQFVTAFTLSPLTEVRDVTLFCTIAGTV